MLLVVSVSEDVVSVVPWVVSVVSAVLSLVFSEIMRKLGWIKHDDMKLEG